MSLVCDMAIGQKVKFDDDVVLIDKVKKYDFIRTQKGGMTGLSNAILKDLSGNIIFEIQDTSLYYDQLPNELGKREAIFTNYLSAPGLGKKVLVPGIISYNIRKEFVKALDEFGFFKTGILDEAIFEKLVLKYKAKEFELILKDFDVTNKERFDIAKLIEKTFGPLVVREPGKASYFNDNISDGKLNVGKFVLEGKGSYASTYKIISSNGAHVASLTIIPSESKANVRSILDERRHWFYFKSNSLSPPSSDDMMRFFFDSCTKYVLDSGYL